jgi:thiamine-monophosphate kinase
VKQPSTDALSRAPKPSEGRQQLLLRQLRPSPRVAWGQLLGEKRLATAMIDLSDGLSSDLSHLCRESGVGARLDASLVPVNPALERIAANSDDALDLALHGGEDFELLFTVRPRHVGRLPSEVGGVAATRIGEVTDDVGKMTLLRGGRRMILRPSGFQHFKRARRTD